MARPKNHAPTYKHHKPTNTARCWVGGRWVSLGRYGSPESLSEFARLSAQAAASTPHKVAEAPAVAPAPDRPADLTVSELLVLFMGHADGYYRHPDGRPTSELHNYKLSLRPLREAFGGTPAREFGPLALMAVRDRMVARGWVRKQVNARVDRIKRVFKWAVARQLVPPAVYAALAAVEGLKAGRSAARERPPVPPVPDATVDATLPFLSRHVRGLVEFQRLTGCRPGEACAVRLCDVDATGAVWTYRPPQHKTAYRGKERAIALGPNAQALVERFRTADPTEYLFSPARAVAEAHAVRAAARKTPRPPSQLARTRKAEPKRKPAARYTVQAYDHAVAKAAKKAGVAPWHPNQLRHTFATKARRLFGMECAGAALGHAKMSATEVYAQRDAALAADVAAKIG